MDSLVELKRSKAKFNINANPTLVEVTRTIKNTNTQTGVTNEEVYNLGTYKVRITGAFKTKLVTVKGKTKSVDYIEYLLLGDHTVDFKAQSNITDSFMCQGKQYTIKSVLKNMENGKVVSVQALLEEEKCSQRRRKNRSR